MDMSKESRFRLDRLEALIAQASREFDASDTFGFGSSAHNMETELTKDLVTARDTEAEPLLHMAVLEIAAWRREHPEWMPNH